MKFFKKFFHEKSPQAGAVLLIEGRKNERMERERGRKEKRPRKGGTRVAAAEKLPKAPATSLYTPRRAGRKNALGTASTSSWVPGGQGAHLGASLGGGLKKVRIRKENPISLLLFSVKSV